MLTAITNKEMAITQMLAGDFARHPQQVNKMYEADAEIIRVSGKEDEYLVIKTDSIHEEIKEKLYEDPWLIGWMAVTAPVSDIAAVGAVPTGILLSIVLPKHCDGNWITRLKKGIADACDHYKIYVLGGDTNLDEHFSISATVIASIKSQKPLLRIGMKPGDRLYTTAALGEGNAYAYTRLLDQSLSTNYQPVARLNESRLISGFASSCMDTSDGLFPALGILSAVNSVGFSIEVPLRQILSGGSMRIVKHAALPEWMLLAGPHGEYELLFTIPAEIHDLFQQTCKQEDWHPIYIGRVIAEQQVNFITGSTPVQCHPFAVPNLFYEAGGNVTDYFDLLMRQHTQWTKEKVFYETKEPQPADHPPEYQE